jgi:flagellar biosynthesis GTPase FlhF
MVPLGVRNVTPDKGEMVKTSSELAVAVNGVMITDQVSYSEADTLLARIQTARKTWNIRMYGTKDKPGPIPQIRSGLDQLYELNREIDQPLEKMEGRVKQAMRDFKLAEARQARELQEAKEAEQARLEEQRLAAEAAAAAARTPQMRGKLEKKVEEIAQQQETVAAVESESPVVGVRSSDRKVKKWRLQHDEEQGSHLGELLMAVIEGKVPEDAILLNVVYINKLYKERPDVVRSWPGIEEYEDVQIVGR